MKHVMTCGALAICILGMLGCGDAAEFKRTREAAEQGDVDAQSKLGYMYAEGWGVEKDQAEAMKWYTKAAAQGDYIAQGELDKAEAKARELLEDNAEAPTTPVATPAVPAPESSPSASGTPRAIETRTFADIEMVWVLPGTFTMGSNPGESGRDNDERQHQVTVTQGFWLGRYEVTKAQWQAVMGTKPWVVHRDVRDEATTPATHVTWNDTQVFVRELNARGEGRFGLPTEAQWEYACRAGTTTAYCFGDDVSPLGTYGWYAANTWSVDEKYAHPVGQKRPNTWGLYDMHGNVWEWCQDWHAQEYPNASVSDPTGPGSGSHRIMRGGGWRNVLPSYRSANRFKGTQADLSARLGFRVCRDADE